MLIWCGMVIFPVRREERDGYGRPFTREFVVNGCLIPHLMRHGTPSPNNDNEELAA